MKNQTLTTGTGTGKGPNPAKNLNPNLPIDPNQPVPPANTQKRLMVSVIVAVIVGLVVLIASFVSCSREKGKAVQANAQAAAAEEKMNAQDRTLNPLVQQPVQGMRDKYINLPRGQMTENYKYQSVSTSGTVTVDYTIGRNVDPIGSLALVNGQASVWGVNSTAFADSVRAYGTPSNSVNRDALDQPDNKPYEFHESNR